jgi:hypothetical protein
MTDNRKASLLADQIQKYASGVKEHTLPPIEYLVPLAMIIKKAEFNPVALLEEGEIVAFLHLLGTFVTVALLAAAVVVVLLRHPELGHEVSAASIVAITTTLGGRIPLSVAVDVERWLTTNNLVLLR